MLRFAVLVRGPEYRHSHKRLDLFHFSKLYLAQFDLVESNSDPKILTIEKKYVRKAPVGE
jgi:hypothetical protein